MTFWRFMAATDVVLVVLWSAIELISDEGPWRASALFFVVINVLRFPADLQKAR